MGKFNHLISLKSTPEIYSFLFWSLVKIQRGTKTACNTTKLNTLIERIKCKLINHEPLNKNDLLREVEDIKNLLPESDFQFIHSAINFADIENTPLEKKWENAFHRYWESLFATEFLSEPTGGMLESVTDISRKLIILLKNNATKPEISVFLNKISSLSHEQEAFGKFSKSEINVQDVVHELEHVSKNNLITVILIHYTFARILFRKPLQLETPLPVVLLDCKLKEHLKKNKITDHIDEYINHLPEKSREDFIDHELRGASIFKDWKLTRGRGDFTENLSTNVSGLCLLRQDRNDLPRLPKSISWEPDAICQQPYYESDHVKNILKNDLVYTSGPSGMTTLLLGMAELFCVLPTQELKEYYALTVACYLVGGGLHSLHEVLLVAHDLLGYFPSYSLGKYQAVLDHFKLDAANSKINTLWDKYFNYCERNFARKALNSEFTIHYKSYFESKLANTILNNSDQLPTVYRISQSILSSVNKYFDTVNHAVQSNPHFAKELFADGYFGRLDATTERDALTQALEALANPNTPLTQIIHIHAVFSRFLPKIIRENSAYSALSTSKLSLFNNDKSRGRVTINNKPALNDKLGISKHPYFIKVLNAKTAPHLRGMDEFGPDITSATYGNIVNSSNPFVSGVSGHAIRLFEAAESYCKLTDEEWKEYSAAAFAYLTAGGNHSYYEVISAAKAVGLPVTDFDYPSNLPYKFKQSNSYQVLNDEFPQLLEEALLPSTVNLKIA